MNSRLAVISTPLIVSLLVASTVTACRSVAPPQHNSANATAVDGGGNSVVNGGRGTAARPGLSLRIVVEVAGRTEIEATELRITEAGHIRLPLLGKVNVAGRSLSEMESFLAGRYAEYFVRPRVTVDFANASREGLAPWGSVTVLGRVRQPGRVSLPPTRDLTVSAAIQEAGGLDSSARDSAIRVTRPREDGTEQSFRVNLRAVGRRGRSDLDLVLQEGDVVYVPEAMF